ncbi:MAG: RluA family pseudouridine synthase [Planctomycetales bacterium]|nr:RluA family pseudouridine synthase [Planctomycetales bacterium]
MSESDDAPQTMTFVVDASQEGMRLDQFLAAAVPQFSRVHLRRVITAGAVQVDGRTAKPAFRLNAGQQVALDVPDLPRPGPEPEAIALDILFEDEHLAAINKPAGMVVHPAKGHWSGTLTSALAHHFTQLSEIGGPTRPGIVHRLDRETSGVIVVAKTDRAHMNLAAQFEARTTRKEYFALTHGTPDRDADVIRQPIGAHPYQREKMAIRADHSTSRDAETFYQVLERYRGYAAVKVLPKTGRTHQIRVHLAHVGYAVLCDRLYSGRSQITRGEILGPDAPDADTILLDRVALHALQLEIDHPVTGERLVFSAPLPADIAQTQEALRRLCG